MTARLAAWWHLVVLRWRRDHTAWQYQRWPDDHLEPVLRFRRDAVRMAEEGRLSDRPPWRY